MENYSIILFILAIMISLSAITEKIRLPYPVLMVCAGIGIGFIPVVQNMELNPEIIFLLFLPPLLYDAAFNISYPEFKTHINTISALAIGLVFLTAGGIAVIAHFLIPGMSWSLAFVLGAILSATDAVAAIGITKGLGLTEKTVTILEGESLINDASALVTYRFAVGAVTGTVFVWWKASIDFILLLAGGFAAGFLIGKLLSVVLYWVRTNRMVVISLSLLMPFVTYLIAEDLKVSGVIAVVVLGLSMSYLSRKEFPEEMRHHSKSFWDILVFILNGLIFILIGLQLPHVLKSIDATQVFPNLMYAILITLTALLIRMARMFLQRINLQRGFKYNKGRIQEASLLDFQTSLIISWSGMRGIISLAMAIGLPYTMSDGTEFPMRDTIIFISTAVVLFTLIGQGLLLPIIVKRLRKYTSIIS